MGRRELCQPFDLIIVHRSGDDASADGADHRTNDQPQIDASTMVHVPALRQALYLLFPSQLLQANDAAPSLRRPGFRTISSPRRRMEDVSCDFLEGTGSAGGDMWHGTRIPASGGRGGDAGCGIRIDFVAFP